MNMTQHQGILERVLNRLLREARGDESLALYMTPSRRIGVLYDPGALLQILRNSSSVPYASNVLQTVRGYVYLGVPGSFPCRGSLRVSLSAGPGVGEVLYSVALAMAHPRRLVSDRAAVSLRARARWKKIKDAGKNDALPLDDAYGPGHSDDDTRSTHKNPETPFHQSWHTDDPDDDCEMLSGDDVATSYAYRANSADLARLAFLGARHRETLRRAEAAGFTGSTSELELSLLQAGNSFFDEQY